MKVTGFIKGKMLYIVFDNRFFEVFDENSVSIIKFEREAAKYRCGVPDNMIKVWKRNMREYHQG